MTEREWLAFRDPTPMLAYVEGRTSERALRLFAIACSRRVEPWMRDTRSRQALETAERMLEGKFDFLIDQAVNANAEDAAEELSLRAEGAADHAAFAAANCAVAVLYPTGDAHAAARDAADQAASAVFHGATAEGHSASEARAAERFLQADLARDIFLPFANPRFRDALVHRDGDVLGQLVRAIYDERAFDRLPILADALEDAGCTDAVILDHCRGGRTHVRGCWLVDRLLSKE
jgi:hypothetical protein